MTAGTPGPAGPGRYSVGVTNILQTEPWADFQRALGHTVLQDSGRGWSWQATIEGGRAGRYLYAPYGPIAETVEAFEAAVESLRAAAAEHGCWFVRVEPAFAAIRSGPESMSEAMRRRGFRPSPRHLQPGHTQLVDLRQDEDAILKDMKSTNRNLHRNIHKKGVTFTAHTEPETISILLRFLQQTAERKGFHRQHDDYLRTAAEILMPRGAAVLYVARLEGEPIGASLVYDSDDTRTYAHASMDLEHRKLSAGIPMVVRMILDAKEKGLTTFDLFGTAPDDAGPEHEWHGFTRFKKAFGGTPVEYPGTWDLPVSTGGYAAYTTLRAAREGLGAARSRGRAAAGALREEGPAALRRVPSAAAQRASAVRDRLRGPKA